MNNALRDGVRNPGPGPVVTPRGEKTFWCAGCDKSETGTHIPDGWYGVNQFAGGHTVPPVRIGLYCSAVCLTGDADGIARRGGEIGI